MTLLFFLYQNSVVRQFKYFDNIRKGNALIVKLVFRGFENVKILTENGCREKFQQQFTFSSYFSTLTKASKDNPSMHFDGECQSCNECCSIVCTFFYVLYLYKMLDILTVQRGKGGYWYGACTLSGSIYAVLNYFKFILNERYLFALCLDLDPYWMEALSASYPVIALSEILILIAFGFVVYICICLKFGVILIGPRFSFHHTHICT